MSDEPGEMDVLFRFKHKLRIQLDARPANIWSQMAVNLADEEGYRSLRRGRVAAAGDENTARLDVDREKHEAANDPHWPNCFDGEEVCSRDNAHVQW